MATERVSPDHAHCSLRYYRVFSCCYRPSPQHPLARLSTETLSAGHTMLSLVSHLDLEQLPNRATAPWPPRAWECCCSVFPLCFLFLSLHFLHSTKRSQSIQTIIYHTNHRSSSHILIIIPVQHGLPQYRCLFFPLLPPPHCRARASRIREAHCHPRQTGRKLVRYVA